MTTIEEMKKYCSSVSKWDYSKVRELHNILTQINPFDSAKNHREYHDGLKLVADALALC